jgi:uncharacterized membrane protein YphA (DoxX/SURF4 family)
LNRHLQALWGNRWVELAFRWVLGLIFIYASYHKIIAPADFAKIIYGYGLFPNVTINAIAIVLPFLELILGLCLISGFYPRSAALTAVALLLFFSVILAINLIHGYEFDCGCFALQNPAGKSSSESLIVRDLIYLGLGLQVFLFEHPRKGCLYNGG